MRLRHLLATAVTITVALGGTVLTAPAASADQIWYQGVGRATADAPCPTTTSADKAAGWSEWSPSWAQWANGGTGGYVCTRAITWAHESTGGGGICVLVDTADENSEDPQFIYVLLPGWAVPSGSMVGVYFNAACTDRVMMEDGPFSVPVPFDVVWAQGGEPQAQERCVAAFDEDLADPQPNDIPADLWVCE